MSKFRKKPVVIEAILWDGSNINEILAWAYGIAGLARAPAGPNTPERDRLRVETLEGTMYAERGDWIIRGVKGELYPIKNEIFLETYEPVDA